MTKQTIILVFHLTLTLLCVHHLAAFSNLELDQQICIPLVRSRSMSRSESGFYAGKYYLYTLLKSHVSNRSIPIRPYDCRSRSLFRSSYFVLRHHTMADILVRQQSTRFLPFGTKGGKNARRRFSFEKKIVL